MALLFSFPSIFSAAFPRRCSEEPALHRLPLCQRLTTPPSSPAPFLATSQSRSFGFPDTVLPCVLVPGRERTGMGGVRAGTSSYWRMLGAGTSSYWRMPGCFSFTLLELSGDIAPSLPATPLLPPIYLPPPFAPSSWVIPPVSSLEHQMHIDARRKQFPYFPCDLLGSFGSFCPPSSRQPLRRLNK